MPVAVLGQNRLRKAHGLGLDGLGRALPLPGGFREPRLFAVAVLHAAADGIAIGIVVHAEQALGACTSKPILSTPGSVERVTHQASGASGLPRLSEVSSWMDRGV